MLSIGERRNIADKIYLKRLIRNKLKLDEVSDASANSSREEDVFRAKALFRSAPESPPWPKTESASVLPFRVPLFM